MTNFSDFKKEIIGKLLIGELEIVQYETNNPIVEKAHTMDGYHFFHTEKTITLTCKFKKTDKDRIKELEEENCKLHEKLDSVNKILNPSQEDDL